MGQADERRDYSTAEKRYKDTQIQSLVKTPADKVRSYHDGGGLYLVVDPRGKGAAQSNVASWAYRYTHKKRVRNMGLGAYPGLTLSDAREAAAKWRALKKAGRDPIEARRDELDEEEQARRAARHARASDERARIDEAAKAITFEQAAERYMKTLVWKAGSKTGSLWASRFRDYAYPLLLDRAVASVQRSDVLAILQQDSGGKALWIDKPESASKLRNQIERVLTWAEENDFRPEGHNPAKWEKLKGTLGEQPEGEHYPSLPNASMPAFMVALRGVEGRGATALKFAILTAARSGEVRGATWGEIDLAGRMWTIPGKRMKGNHKKKRAPHRVPLSPAAIAILVAQPRGEGPALVFPAERGGPLSDQTISKAIKTMNGDGRPGRKPIWVDPTLDGAPVVPHGFRTSFRTWVAERTHFPREMAEIALAHTVGNEVERTYTRTDMVDKRRLMMEAWATYCETPTLVGENVRPLHGA